ncbi:MAG: hypothetical protein Q8O71_00020, partial [bacterium]|nr:hypothetical protein [bacterium]
MPKSFEQPPAEALAELHALTKKGRELAEKAITGATTPEEAESALKEAEELVPELARRREAIREKLWPFTELSREKVEAQYNQEVAALETAGVLEKLKSGEHGIVGIDKIEYALPTLAQVVERLRAKKEIVEQKAKQGLLKIQLTPIAMSLDALREKYKARVLAHYADMPDPTDSSKRIPDPARTKLFATKKNSSDPAEPLELDTDDPLYTWDAYENADVAGALVYFPKAFDEKNHKGKTKAELLQQTKQGWDIIILEDLPNLPAKDQGEVTGGRKQLEAGASPNDYLEKMNDSMYQHEQGMTTEDWLILAITHLESTNEVIDDYQGKGKIARNFGQYFPVSG